MYRKQSIVAAGIVALMLVLGAPGAAAQAVDTYGETPDQELPPVDGKVEPDVLEPDDGGVEPEVVVPDDVKVEPEVVVPGDGGPAEVARQPEVRGSRTLPLTGGDVLGLAVIGGGAVLLGAAILLARRRSTV